MPATYSIVAVTRTPQAAAPPTLLERGALRGSISWTEDLRAPGEANVSVNVKTLTGDIKAALLDLGSTPMEVWIYRNTDMVFAGPVISYSVENEVLSLTCRDLTYYLQYMFVITDKTWSAIDQGVIVKEIIDDWQALSYGDYGLDASGIGATGTTRTLALPGTTEPTEALKFVMSLSNSDNGFDIGTVPDTRAVTLWSPLRGADLSATVFLERGLDSPSINVSVAPQIVASEVYGVGTGPDVDPALTSTQSDTAFRAAFGRSGVYIPFDPVTSQAHLDDLAIYEKDARSAQFFQVGARQIISVSDGRYDDFNVGDIVNYSHDVGLGLFTGAFRVVRRVMTVGEDGQEKMGVEFE